MAKQFRRFLREQEVNFRPCAVLTDDSAKNVVAAGTRNTFVGLNRPNLRPSLLLNGLIFTEWRTTCDSL